MVYEIRHDYPSPNFNRRSGGQAPRAIVLHATGGTYPGCCTWMQNPAPGGNPAKAVSTHYVVTKTGIIQEQVDPKMRAWHAGSGRVADLVGDPNSLSIGIEFENADNNRDPYPTAQLDAGIWLCRKLVKEWGITRDHIVTHQSVRPKDKHDPGKAFPMAWFLDQVFNVQKYPMEARATAGNLRVRQAPNTVSKILGKLDQGQTVYIREIREGEDVQGEVHWALIVSGALSGWTSMRYLTMS